MNAEPGMPGIRDLTAAELFTVFADSSDPHHVGEFVVHMDREGITIRESHEETPDGDDERQVSWHELHELSGHAADRMQEIERDTRSVISELEAWEHIRDREAGRILRAKHIQRTQTMRQLCDDAARVLASWERPRVAAKPANTWRDIVARRNGRPGRG